MFLKTRTRILLPLAVAVAAAAALATAAGAAAPPAAPPALTTFAGLTSTQLLGVNPADVQLAVGPTAVVQAVNASVAVWTTAGVPLRTQSLGQFFSGGGIDRSQDAMTDPRVMWDPVSSRFLAAVFDITRLELVVGLSITTDPLGPWAQFSLPSSGCPDQPRLGTSDSLVVVTDDLFSSCRGRGRFLGGEVTILNKQDMLAGVPAPRRSTFGPDSRFSSITPAVSLTPTPTAYLASTSASGNAVELMAVDSSTVSSLPFKDVALRTPLADPDAVPQRGSAQPVDAGDARIQNAVFDNGRLWVTATEDCSGARSCGRVVAIDPVASKLIDDVRISLPSGRSLIYPAAAPDTRGNLVVGFVYTSPLDYPGLGYTYVRPDGAVAAPRDLVAGTAPNESGRFGDYSGASRDPSDPSTIWLSAEIGQAADGTTLGWGSGITAVRVPPQPPAVRAATVTAGKIAAEVFPEGLRTTYRVEYGATTAYGATTRSAALAATVRSQAVSVALPALAPGHTYHARLVATNAAGTTAGADVAFRTPPGAPLVKAAPAARSGSAVQLRAVVSGGGAATTVVFEYGPTRSYGSRTSVHRVGGGSVDAPVVATVRLAPGAYHFRAVARNARGTTAGPDRVVRVR